MCTSTLGKFIENNDDDENYTKLDDPSSFVTCGKNFPFCNFLRVASSNERCKIIQSRWPTLCGMVHVLSDCLHSEGHDR